MNQDIRPDHRGACSFEGCPSFDGKRCRVLGCRPGAEAGCIPRIGEVQEELALTAKALKIELGKNMDLRHRLNTAEDAFQDIMDDHGDYRYGIATKALAAIRKE
jgi:hypothetical protein